MKPELIFALLMSGVVIYLEKDNIKKLFTDAPITTVTTPVVTAAYATSIQRAFASQNMKSTF